MKKKVQKKNFFGWSNNPYSYHSLTQHESTIIETTWAKMNAKCVEKNIQIGSVLIDRLIKEDECIIKVFEKSGKLKDEGYLALHGNAIFCSINEAIICMNNKEDFVEYCRSIGVFHTNILEYFEMFIIFKKIFLITLRDILVDQWTDNLCRVWKKFLKNMFYGIFMGLESK